MRMLKNEYAREWRRKNKEKTKEINKKYWEKKAKEYMETNSNSDSVA